MGAFVALSLALTAPFTVFAGLVPAVDGSGSGTSESPIPAFTPSVDGSGSGTSEGSEPVFVPTVDESGSGTSEGDPLSFASAIVTETPALNVSRSGSSRSGGVIAIESVTPVVVSSVAAVSSTACPYINSFITISGSNDAADVSRLQSFLNASQGASLAVTGAYDAATQDAVAAFQIKHSADILAPWNTTVASKNVYLTTKKKINALVCGESFSLTASELAEITATRDAIINSTPAGTSTGAIGSATSTGSTTDSNVAAAFVGGEFIGKFFKFVKSIFTGSN